MNVRGAMVGLIDVLIVSLEVEVAAITCKCLPSIKTNV